MDTDPRRADAPRSYLFVPGHRPERFVKALDCGVDAVIVDLEDAVGAADKAGAREAVAGRLVAGRGVWLRLSGVDAATLATELPLAAAPEVIGLVLPKIESAEAVAGVAAAQPGRRLIPMIETALGLHQALDIARAPGVERLMFGSLDFQTDLGIDGDGEELLLYRSQLVLVSRLAGIGAPVDGVSPAIEDLSQLSHETRRARRLGFGGKCCIHPRQVATVNAGFTPDAADIAWAERVLTAAQNSAGGAVAVDGKMVDKPLIIKAETILQRRPRV